MVKLYVKKILSGTVNPETGAAWKIEDVPVKWREQVREMIGSSINIGKQSA